MRASKWLLIKLLLLLSLAGCGQKGPLRQPDAPPEKPKAASANDPSSLASRRQNPHE